MATADKGEENYGVLLYYKFTSVSDLTGLLAFYRSNCSSLRLLGRIRASLNGVNVTVSGRYSSLEKHIEAVKSLRLFEGTDFKLAKSCPPSTDKISRECGFTSLSVRIVKELVTFSSSSPMPVLSDASKSGRHLSAIEFNALLKNGEKNSGGKKPVLLDVRNLYETRIGKFSVPGIVTLDPRIRQYSDLPSWIDRNSQHLHGCLVLMYCTGGIRCEVASAYVKSKGAGFEDVFQLYGGIHRYMEQFADGGYFRGKNFVFDHRITAASAAATVVGTCLWCGAPYDDYRHRRRCSLCRMLVLVCDVCQRREGAGMELVCELCSRGFGGGGVVSVAVRKRLRVLCLHGFRQNASGFKGRTASLAKKLRNIAEFTFVDAPHVIDCPSTGPSAAKRFAWLVSPDGRPHPFDELQYRRQTWGVDESLHRVRTVLSEDGPFDGIMGFSQGASMVALLLASSAAVPRESPGLRFAVLCSGFSPSGIVAEGSIGLPSLHVFAVGDRNDRRVPRADSWHLARFFQSHGRVVIEHDSGHIIPTSAPYVGRITAFLAQFM